jgi:hypothetical protein
LTVTSQVLFKDPSVSGQHLRIYSVIFDLDQPEEVPPLVYAEDLSRYGTYWNGVLMGKGNGGYLLSRGDTLMLTSKTELEFHCEANPSQYPVEEDLRLEANVCH